MDEPRRKIFGIGLNKTGTSTLGAALAILGYRVKGRDRAISLDARRGDYRSAFECIERFDAFQDLTWALMMEPIFQRYGTSARYILTVRRSPEVWIDSLRRHSLTAHPIARLLRGPGPYGRRYPIGFEREFLDQYERHNDTVRQFFARNRCDDVLLEVSWDLGDGWPELCRFLETDMPNVPFPNINAGSGAVARPVRYAVNVVAARIFATFG